MNDPLEDESLGITSSKLSKLSDWNAEHS